MTEERIAEIVAAWEHTHAEHMAETGHRAGIDRIYTGDEITGVRVGCVDDQRDACLCGTWETVEGG